MNNVSNLCEEPRNSKFKFYMNYMKCIECIFKRRVLFYFKSEVKNSACVVMSSNNSLTFYSCIFHLRSFDEPLRFSFQPKFFAS